MLKSEIILSATLGLALLNLDGCSKGDGLLNASKESQATASLSGMTTKTALTSISPAYGPVTGGTTIILSGLGFLPGTSITLGGSPCLQIKVLSPQQLQCVTPIHTHGQTTVMITLPDLGAGSKTASLALAFNYQDTTKDLAGYAISAGGITASGTGILMRATIGESGSLQQNGPPGSNIQAQTGVHGVFFSRTH